MAISSSMEEDFSLLKNTVRSAGDIALKFFGNAPDTQTKEDGSPVSEADLAVDEYLRETLLSARANYGWLSEESADDRLRLEKKLIWVVDPIDGTRSFLKQQAEWTISAALVADGRAILAVVYNPVTGEFYEAAKGNRAFLNGTIINVSGTSNEKTCRVMATRKVSDLLSLNTDISFSRSLKVSSLAYRLCLLSSGKTDVVLFKSGAGDWDVAAADLILREAGGCLTAFDAEPLKFNKTIVRHKSLLATNGLLHDALLKVCKKLEF